MESIVVECPVYCQFIVVFGKTAFWDAAFSAPLFIHQNQPTFVKPTIPEHCAKPLSDITACLIALLV